MYVAVDVGGTKTLVARFNAEGVRETETKFPTPHDYMAFIETLEKTIDELKGNDLKAIGIAVPGTLNYATSVVTKFGNLDWEDVDIRHELEQRFNVPVAIDNDANLGAVAEARQGAGAKFEEVLYITISTGIGTGITTKGSIDPALANSEGGMMHFYHEGKLKIWEKFASGNAFVERFGSMGKDMEDPAVWRRYAEDLSLGIGSLIAVIQPDVVVIGGSMGEHLHKYYDFLIEALNAAKAPIIEIPPIVAADDPTQAVINGAYLLAQELSRAQ